MVNYLLIVTFVLALGIQSQSESADYILDSVLVHFAQALDNYNLQLQAQVEKNLKNTAFFKESKFSLNKFLEQTFFKHPADHVDFQLNDGLPNVTQECYLQLFEFFNSLNQKEK